MRRYTELRQFYERNLAELREQSGFNELAQGPEPCKASDRLCRLERIGQRP